jgi:DNA-binding Xre family transcriptional regulator
MTTILKKIMIERRIKNIEMARRVAVSESMVSHWRAGRVWVPQKYHEKLVDLLDVPIEEFIDPKTNLPRFSKSD